MRKATETRLNRLVEARHEQDAAVVRGAVSDFVNRLTPVELYECREPDVCRERLNDFLATQPAKVITTIERWATRKGAK